jgi:ABC-type phosphate transport system substrate-binding protein
MKLQKPLRSLGIWLAFALVLSPAQADVVVVVSAQSPVNSLSRAELADIFLGRLSRLPTGDPVVPIDQAERTPAYNEFYSVYIGQTAAQVKAHWSRLIFTGRGRPPQSVASSAAAAELVAGNPNAIAYVSSDVVDARLRIVTLE